VERDREKSHTNKHPISVNSPRGLFEEKMRKAKQERAPITVAQKLQAPADGDATQESSVVRGKAGGEEGGWAEGGRTLGLT